MANTTSNIEAKMVEMKMKNFELLKRHKEIEEDRQRAQTLSSNNNNNETNSTTSMRNTMKNRTRIISNQNYVQEQNERNQRVVMRRKRERVQDGGNSLNEYVFPSESQRSTTKIDEATSAKKSLLANNSTNRFATAGRLHQQEHGQRRREDRMRRCLLSNNGTNPNQFHFDVPQAHFHVFPPPEHLINTTNEPIEFPNFLYPPVPFQSNGTFYFAQAPPLMATPIAPPPPPPPPTFSSNNFHSTRPTEDLPPRFRRLKDLENSTASRSQLRPQSFHDFPSNHRNQRFALSAYLNPDESSFHQPRRRPMAQQRISSHDKHQFPLSLYDPRQYEIDTSTLTSNENDSGNSSLSTSFHLKESTFDDFTSLPSDVSTSDSNIIESLDKLQQDLKLEEDLEKQLDNSSGTGEPTTYDTAHFLQWAKEKFREELAGRLTAQEIEQHDAVITDDDEDEDFSLPAVIKESQVNFSSILDEDFEHQNETIDELKETLTKNLNFE